MQRLLFTLIACTTLLGHVQGQEFNAKAKELEPEFANLHAFVGSWELTVDGSSEKGSAEIKSILGGRFVTEDVKLSFGTFKMEWHGVYSYDRTKKQYTGIWFDNVGNTTRSDSGEADNTGRILTFRGEQAGKIKFVWRISNDGRKTLTIEMLTVSKDGKESPAMKVQGERLK